MMKKLITLLLILGLSIQGFSQKKYSKEVGLTTREELELKICEKDSTAKALVLYDYANVYVDPDNEYDFRTDYYRRIKLFDKSEADRATIRIRTYKEQKVKHIKAITYTLEGEIIKKTHVLDDQIYTKQISENRKEISFTLPNIQDGCVIEYSYSFLNPYNRVHDWYFQEDIPVKESLFRASIPGNWKFKSRLIGFEKLDIDNVSIQKRCLTVPGASRDGDCVLAEYGMSDVPAFKEEAHMLSEQNFLSRLSYDLISFTDVYGSVTKYTKEWKDADKTLKDYFLDKQTSKKDYFKKKIPADLFTIQDHLEKAKKAYYFIQDRMSWNKNYWTSKNIKVKRIYDTKVGSVEAINLVLYNTLQALGIESYMVALSTRNNGIPTKLYPVVNDFNYMIVKATINGESYFLDVTDKFLSFGEVPMRCLNGEARVLDFKKGSYWEKIKPRFKSSSSALSELSFNKENQLEGFISIRKKGYYALEDKTKFKNMNEDEMLDEFETSHPYLETDEVDIKGLDDNEKPIVSTYQIIIDVDEQGNLLEVNPFIYNQTTKNPFKLNERKYPVDYGYTRSMSSVVNIKIPEGYSVKSLPEEKAIGLPLKGGKYVLRINQTEYKISFYSRLNINKKVFSADEYHYLKEFFNQIINSRQANVVFEKNAN